MAKSLADRQAEAAANKFEEAVPPKDWTKEEWDLYRNGCLPGRKKHDPDAHRAPEPEKREWYKQGQLGAPVSNLKTDPYSKL